MPSRLLIALLCLISAVGPSARAAEFDPGAKGFWTKMYSFPSHYKTFLIELRPAEVRKAREALESLLADSGAHRAPTAYNGTLRQYDQVRTAYPNGGYSYSSKPKADAPGDYNEIWEVPGDSATVLAQKILGLGVIMQFQQTDASTQTPAADIAALYFKRDGLRREMKASSPGTFEDMPGIFGLFEAQMNTLDDLIASHEKAGAHALVRVALRAP